MVFLGGLFSKVAGPLMKFAISLAKNILTPLGLMAVALAIDAGSQKKILGSEVGTHWITLFVLTNDVV